MKASSSLSTFICITLLTAASSLCSAQTSYTITDLGTLSSHGFSWAHGINATGEVTGASSGGGGSEVFLDSNGTLTGLGTLGGSSGVGNGINTSGQVAGYSQNSSQAYRAFVSNGSTLLDLGDLGGGSAVAYALNDSGQVVGSAVTANGENHPFIYSNGQMTDLGTLGSTSQEWNSAQGINNNGAVTGTSYDAKGNFRAFFWSNGTIKEMGALGGDWSQGYAINNRGQVTGIAYTKKNAQAHAFIANCATCKFKDLGTLAATGISWGFGINDAGVVVGRATTQTGSYLAFVYSNGKIKNLNKMIPAGSGWVLLEADSINAAGQIAGMGMHNGQEHAYLLTPQ